MKTKVLYTLVSTNNDVYYEQTFLSLFTLRAQMPDVHVALLIDGVTDDTLIDHRAALQSMINEKIVINLDRSLTNLMRSRLLKTNMRNYIDGDFLYIDADTIILSPLNEIDNCECDIGAVLETNKLFSNNSNKQFIIEATEKIGHHLKNDEKYYNSGVMFVRDNSFTRDFFNSWCKIWLEGTEKNVFFDQPSLAKVNSIYNYPIKELSGEWNGIGKYCINYVRYLKIFHYVYDPFFEFPLVKKETFMNLKKTGEIDANLLTIISDPFKSISNINEILSGDMALLIHTRLFAVIRNIYFNQYKLFKKLDSLITWLFDIYLRYFKKNRKYTPPRKH